MAINFQSRIFSTSQKLQQLAELLNDPAVAAVVREIAANGAQNPRLEISPKPRAARPSPKQTKNGRQRGQLTELVVEAVKQSSSPVSLRDVVATLDAAKFDFHGLDKNIAVAKVLHRLSAAGRLNKLRSAVRGQGKKSPFLYTGPSMAKEIVP